MSSAAQATPGPGERYRVLRELGRRARRTFAAIREPHELVVLQRFVRRDGSGSGVAEVARTEGGATSTTSLVALPEETATQVTAEQIALLLRDARALEKHWHPNVARVKHVTLGGGDLRVATELLDGITLEDLVAAAATRGQADRARLLSLPVLLRILVDVLGGLHGVHGLRDGINAPLDAMHGELSPTNVVVGRDGVARLVAVLRPRPVRLTAATEAAGYAAPEMLDSAAVLDARADVYAVGVMLWEAMRGARLYPSHDLAEIAQRQRSEELEEPALPASSPFAPLADVAMKALAFDPALRFRTASEMAAEIRRIAGTRLAPGSVVAQTVAELAGERIRSRRAELDPVASGTRRRASSRSMPAAEGPLGGDGDAGWSLTPPAGTSASDAMVTGPVSAVPVLADLAGDDSVEVEIDETARIGVQRMPTAPPREGPKAEARYMVVPARPMRESVDGEALDDAAHASTEAPSPGEPSTARIKAAGIPRPFGKGIATAPAAFTPPGLKLPPRPTDPKPATPAPGAVAKVEVAVEPASERIELGSAEIEAASVVTNRDEGEESDDAPTAVGRPPPGAFAPPLPARARASKVPQARASEPAAPSPASSTRPRGAEDAAARAEIPRLWTESSHDLSASTNVLEGDFVRALKAAASEPPMARASKLPDPGGEGTSVTLPRAEVTPELAGAAELLPSTTDEDTVENQTSTPAPGVAGAFFAGTVRVLSMSVLDADEVSATSEPSLEAAPPAAPEPPAPPVAITPSFVPPAAPPPAVNGEFLGVPAFPAPAAPGDRESDLAAFAATVPALPRPTTPVVLRTASSDVAEPVDELPRVDEARRARARRLVVGVVGGCAALLLVAVGVSALGGSSRETRSAGPRPGAATTNTLPAPVETAKAEPPAPKPGAEPAKVADAPSAPSGPAATTTATSLELPETSEAKTATPKSAPPPKPAAAPAVARPPAATTQPARPTSPPAARPTTRPKKPSYDPLGI